MLFVNNICHFNKSLSVFKLNLNAEISYHGFPEVIPSVAVVFKSSVLD